MASFSFDRPRGDTIKLLITCTRPDGAGVQQPLDITGDTLYFTAKPSLALPDNGTGVIQCSSGDGIEILDGPAGKAVATIRPAATVGLERDTTYRCDVEHVAANGDVTTVAEGVLKIHRDATRTY